MTAGTVVITGGILATVILLCIIAVLCYCRLQYYCCKKEDSEEEGDEPDFGVDPRIPPLHCNRNVALTNGPSLYRPSPSSPHKKTPQGRTLCPSCSHYEPPSFFLQEPAEEEEEEEEEEEGVRNGGNLVNYKALSQEDLEAPAGLAGLQALDPNRLSASRREAFSRSRSISTDV